MCEENATHNIPRALQGKLVEAKEWRDERMELEKAIAWHGGSAQRNQEDRDEFDRRGAALLEAIVELCDEAWGFAPELEKSSDQ